MAFRTSALVLDENLPIHRGKRADGLKTNLLKPAAKAGLQERKALRDVSNTSKALRDLSNTGKPPASSIAKGAALKEKSVLHSRQTTTKNAVKSEVLANEETRTCHEWAKEGIEHAHFTSKDMQELQKDQQDERVKKKVQKIMSSLHGWSDAVFDPVMFPVKEAAKCFEETRGLEFEPEILQDVHRQLTSSGDTLIDDLFTEPELDQLPFLEKRVEFQLTDDDVIMDNAFYT